MPVFVSLSLQCALNIRTMRPRKRYLDPGGSVDNIPYSTRRRLEQETPNSTNAVSTQCDVSVPSPTASASAVDFDTPLSPLRPDDFQFDDDGLPEPAHLQEDCFDAGWQPDDDAELGPSDLLALTVSFVIQHGLSWSAAEDLQKLISYVLQRFDVPATKYLFKKNTGVTMETTRFHFYCDDCMQLVAETSGSLADRNAVHAECPGCGRMCDGRPLLNDGNFYLSLPIKQQLTSLLAANDVSTALSERLTDINSRPDTGTEMSDITDGSVYRAVRQKLNCHDLTLTINADGSPLFKSSKYSIWPVQIMINELPEHLRHKNVLVSMLWYGQTHPDMSLLLSTFVEQMEDLAAEGITWNAGAETVQSKIYCLSCCADAPARAIMQNMYQFNGHYGCGWCLHPGEVINGTVKYTVCNPVPERDTEETLVQMIQAAATGKPVLGVKGPTPLMNLDHFDVVWGFTPDYMHCVLLGTTRQLVELWLTSVGKPFYIGCPALSTKLDKRLCSIKPPSCLHRLQRSLSVRRYWKATEWQQWLLCFSLPCLHGILKPLYLQHFALLVRGITLLLQDQVTQEDVSGSIDCLVQFALDVETLYDKGAMTFNVHQLLHLPKSVLHHGPLWAHSCFAFESNIGQVKDLVTSAKGVPMQIVERLTLRSSFADLKAQACPRTQAFLGGGSVPKQRSVVPLGKPRTVSPPILLIAKNQIGDIIGGPVVEYDRVSVHNVLLHSEQYGKPNKTDSTAAMLPSGVCFKADHILSFDDVAGNQRVFAVSRKFCTAPAYRIAHILKVRQGPSSLRVLVDLAHGIVPCIYMEVERKTYFVPLAGKAIFKSQ